MVWRRALAALVAFLLVPLGMLVVVSPAQSPLAVLIVLVVIAVGLLARSGVSRWAAVGWIVGCVVWLAYVSALAGNLLSSG